jgi:hypothetical protein
MKKINRNIDFIVNKTKWSNADAGDTLEAQYGNPSLTDAYFKSWAIDKNISKVFGMNDVIIKEIISKSKKIASKYSNFTKLNVDELVKIKGEFEAERLQASRNANKAMTSLTDKYDDIVTSRLSASDIGKRNIRDVEGTYPNINHKHGNLIKNVLDNHITMSSDSAIINYLDYLIAKSKLVDDEIEYAKEKNTYAIWKKLEGRGILDNQKKIITDNIKALTPKVTTGSKVDTTATANELVNGTEPTSMKKWIIIGAGGLLVIGVLFFVFRKSSN